MSLMTPIAAVVLLAGLVVACGPIVAGIYLAMKLSRR